MNIEQIIEQIENDFNVLEQCVRDFVDEYGIVKASRILDMNYRVLSHYIKRRRSFVPGIAVLKIAKKITENSKKTFV